jgi:hypothetical protein
MKRDENPDTKSMRRRARAGLAAVACLWMAIPLAGCRDEPKQAAPAPDPATSASAPTMGLSVKFAPETTRIKAGDSSTLDTTKK